MRDRQPHRDGLMHRRKPMEHLSAFELVELAGAINHIADYVESLRERVRLLEAVIENFPGGISLFDEDLQLVICNERQKEMLGYSAELFAEGPPSMEKIFRFNATRGEYGAGDIEEQVERRMALARECQPHRYERTRPNGRVLEIRGAPIDGGGFVTTYLDVTEDRRNQALITHMAHHDVLTDLPNRALFADRMQTAVAMAKRVGMAAVHYLDIDGFKSVNDRLGHKTGDDLLVAIANRLKRSVRENDTVARLGGDEFAVVQTGIREEADAAVLARRIVQEVGQPYALAGETVTIGVSAGIALATTHGITNDELLRKADAALYRSKTGGRGCFHFYRDSKIVAD
jgi:diguanylate cyclase (GGDEF)-like protein